MKDLGICLRIDFHLASHPRCPIKDPSQSWALWSSHTCGPKKLCLHLQHKRQPVHTDATDSSRFSRQPHILSQMERVHTHLVHLQHLIGNRDPFSLKLILLEYSCLTMLCWFLLQSDVSQYVYTYHSFLGFPSHLGHHRAWSRVPWAVRQVLISSLFYTQ